MTRKRLIPTTLGLLLVLFATLPARSSAHRSSAASAGLSVIARHLDQPKKLTLAANGDLRYLPPWAR
jgi:hypothetical protein